MLPYIELIEQYYLKTRNVNEVSILLLYSNPRRFTHYPLRFYPENECTHRENTRAFLLVA